jgi:hypothetical protein
MSILTDSTPIDRVIKLTGWQRDVVEHLFRFYQEMAELSFDEFVVACYGHSGFSIAANQGLDLSGCLMAQDIAIELLTEKAANTEDSITESLELSASR